MKNKLFYIFSILVIVHVSNISGYQSPVIFVPGDGGSQIDAKLNKQSAVHVFCQKTTSDFFNIWLNLELLVPLVIDCWIDNVKLYYNNETRKTENTPGVETRIPGWGSPEPVEWLDPSKASSGAYFKDIGNALVADGYQRNVSLRGAPYDFRKAPNENEQWFVDFKELIEETYSMNNGTPVTIVAHSMGGPMTLVFLQRQISEWKNQHIKRFITLAGAWAGSVKAVKVFAMGDDLGSYVLRNSILREEQISCPSLSWLLPSPLFWKPNEVMATTKSRNYTLAQLSEFFDDLEYPQGWEMRKDNIQYSLNFSPPDVETHCIYGSGIPTVERLMYKKEILDGLPTLINGDGDGTVNIRSLSACSVWKTMQDKPVVPIEIAGVDHMTVLKHPDILNYIHKILKADENEIL
ncbi:group XV phospholipase A2-like [Ctenocephalides felis]|uniref:group XV phospholipase A2-like n=1 Tax=Ctenocephalides felis TaxID=7515 RepID=UPI000E6E2692|nr:group XV phospholipase A2-like [Ctenocephalides felis]